MSKRHLKLFNLINVIMLSLVLASGSFISVFASDTSSYAALSEASSPAVNVAADKETSSSNDTASADDVTDSNNNKIAGAEVSNKDERVEAASGDGEVIQIQEDSIDEHSHIHDVALNTSRPDSDSDRPEDEKTEEEKETPVRPGATPIKYAGHATVYLVEEVSATCTEDGIKAHYHCNACGHDFDIEEADARQDGKITGSLTALSKEDLRIPAGHHWDDGAVTKVATTTREGEMTYTCMVCGDTYTEIIPRLEAAVVFASDGYSDILVETDASGAAYLRGILYELDKDSNASETVKMLVDGKAYSFTRFANGTVVGNLPDGFEIAGNALKISDLSGDMNISITEHTALSSTYEAPSSTGAYDDGSYYEPAAKARTGRRATARANVTGTGVYTGINAGLIDANAEDSLNASGTDTNANADESAAEEEISEALKSLLNAPLNLSGLGEGDASSTAKVLLVADIAAGLLILAGLWILWKLGLISR